MSQYVSKALEFMDIKDLECAICLSRFQQPKTLKCMHTYCLECIQKWVETNRKMKCPTCGQEHNLTKYDLKELSSNTMVSQLLEYVEKTEDQKPSKCSCCDINQPEYHCQTCQLYICGAPCIKQHQIIPSLRNHSLYTLDKKEEGICDEQSRCKVHKYTALEFFCSSCNKSACKHCERILRCYQKEHKVIPMSAAVNEFNKDVTEILQLAHEIENKLKGKLEFITKNRSEYDSHLEFCRTAIKILEKKIIKTVTEKSKESISNLEERYKEKKEDIDIEIEDIDSKMTEVNNLIASMNIIMSNPDERDILESHKTTINTVRDKVLGKDFFQRKIITPDFISSTYLDELMVAEGIGTVTTADITYKVDKDDEAITVTTEQPFKVTVSRLIDSDDCPLTAVLINSSGVEALTETEYINCGNYKIRGRCIVEGDWLMEITAGAAHIKGSPVNITVEPHGLVHTIANISDYKEHIKTNKVSDVVLNTDGCILVSSYSKDIIKFNQSGSFVARVEVPQDVMINKMHVMEDGYIMYSDYMGKCVVMCDEQFQEFSTFGKGIMKDPNGLTVNMKTRVLYVADCEAQCVFKFNVDDGTLLGKIQSNDCKFGELDGPYNVTITKEDCVIVTDFANHSIQMFDTNEKFIKKLTGYGMNNGDVWGPSDVTIDMDENIIVSSNHKLQLFDEHGIFIKRIDYEDDGLDTPAGIAVISNRPRRVAVANHGQNNVKIFNY